MSASAQGSVKPTQAPARRQPRRAAARARADLAARRSRQELAERHDVGIVGPSSHAGARRTRRGRYPRCATGPPKLVRPSRRNATNTSARRGRAAARTRRHPNLFVFGNPFGGSVPPARARRASRADRFPCACDRPTSRSGRRPGGTPLRRRPRRPCSAAGSPRDHAPSPAPDPAGNTSSRRFSPTMATWSPSAGTHSTASSSRAGSAPACRCAFRPAIRRPAPRSRARRGRDQVAHTLTRHEQGSTSSSLANRRAGASAGRRRGRGAGRRRSA